MIPQAGLPTPLHRTDWQTARFKFLFEKRNRPVHEDDGVVTAFRDGVVTLRSNRREDGFTFADKEIGYQGVEPGDLVIHAMDGFAGAIGVCDSRGKCSPVYSMVTPRVGVQAEPRFWAYYLRNLATTGFIQSLAKGIRERSTDFRWRDAGNLLVNFPDLETQKSIADFLDRETARIDQLIEKKRRLLDVTIEKQSSEVLRIVESSEWQRRPLSRVVKLLDGDRSAEYPSDTDIQESGVPFFSSRQIKRRQLTLDDVKYISDEKFSRLSRGKLQDGDIIVTVRGTLGNTAVFRSGLAHTGFINAQLMIMRPQHGFDPELVHFFTLSSAWQNQIEIEGYGSAQKQLNQDVLRRFKIRYPVNGSVAAWRLSIRECLNQFDRLTALIEDSIDRLFQYRSALITSAVTGQFDVANWGKRGQTNRHLDKIESLPHRKEVRA
jgi:type I restriction enzyme S subunit